ncbi:MAG: TrkH family potassium uptake protein [Actinomycetota bacterium]|nr:TrkH family potassium uptake protein [Rubrobacter sp.]MDQ3509152.1 TrkH family potassium uptake protein [Actinomycetota bacterium]
MHIKVIANALGVVAAALGAAMLVPGIFAAFTGEGNAPIFLVPAFASIVGGGVLFYFTRRNENTYVSIRDVFLIVSLGWIGVAAIGSIPFAVSGTLSPVNAFFDSMAGFTTTGASTILVPEDTAASILLWRSMSQWAGGIGIIVLFVSIAPIVGFGATQLYSAEMPNPTQERITPRIQDTAKVLTYIYLSLTVGISAALLLAGMGLFDAVNHAFTTVATGGYSTRSDSIAAFDSAPIEAVIIVGMILSGTNFTLYFFAAQGRLRRAATSPELLAYLGIIATGALIMTGSLYFFDYNDSLLRSFREALFQSASLSSGTAFSTADWNAWDSFSQAILMVLMAIGGCAGSTSGGIKVVRIVLLAKSAAQDAFRMIHPRAVTPLTMNGRVVPERLRVAFLGFFFVYGATLAVGTLLIALHQVPLGSAFGAVFACVNITGTSLGPVGDPDFYAALPASAKFILAFFMLLGRLELFTVLVLLTPAFWRT